MNRDGVLRWCTDEIAGPCGLICGSVRRAFLASFSNSHSGDRPQSDYYHYAPVDIFYKQHSWQSTN